MNAQCFQQGCMKSNRNMPAATQAWLRRGVHRSTRELADAIRRYVDLNDRHHKPFIWTRTADQILESLSRFCQRISNSRHSGEA